MFTSAYIDDEFMDDCSDESSGYNTEVVPDELDEASTEEENDNPLLPFDPDCNPSFVIGSNTAPTPWFQRPHSPKRERVPARPRIRHASSERVRTLSLSSGPALQPYQRNHLSSLRPPTPKQPTPTPDFSFAEACQSTPDPVSPYKPPSQSHVSSLQQSKLRSKSMLHIPTNALPHPCLSITVPPLNLDSLSSKENEENTLVSSSTFIQAKPKTSREEDNDLILSNVRRTVSDLVLPSPPMINREPLQRRSTGILRSRTMSNYPSKLPVTKQKDTCDFISTSTVVDVMTGKYNHHFDKFIIIDCRYTYEFQGGHIKNAISIIPSEREEKLKEYFMTNPKEHKNLAIIFHCEFSSKRGPATWRLLRKMDRDAHGFEKHNELYYPYLYVMEGGYQNFYRDFPLHCDGLYIRMYDDDYKEELTKNLRADKLCEKQRSNSVLISRKKRQLSKSQQCLPFSQR